MTSTDSCPCSAPLASMDDIANWHPTDKDLHNVAGIAWRPRASASGQGDHESPGQIIFCHDMAGGYREDKYIQGLQNHDNLYSFQYWQFVDIFIYFSHARGAVPPVNWTNAAHRNGVKMLATLITEWEPGVSENLKLIYGPDYIEGITDEEAFSPFFADKLVEIAQFYKFDGWFINIEAPLGHPRRAYALAHFLSYLKMRLHETIPGSLLIWYDSLVLTGEIRWQDRLSPANQIFFDVTDGIFINYTWRSNFPSLSAAAAGNRKRDVFTGIDVWGRNTFGGGGHNSHKALRVISKAKTSTALFAPGWTYEFFGSKHLELSDRRFWVDPHCPVPFPPTAPGEKPSSGREDPSDLGCIRSYVPERPAGTQTMFYTDFDQGHGNAYHIRGKPIHQRSWFHLSRQSIPPTYRTIDHIQLLQLDADAKTFEHSTSSVLPYVMLIKGLGVETGVAYNGGSSLAIRLTDAGVHQLAESNATGPVGFVAETFKARVCVTEDTRVEGRFRIDRTQSQLQSATPISVGIRVTLHVNDDPIAWTVFGSNAADSGSGHASGSDATCTDEYGWTTVGFDLGKELASTDDEEISVSGIGFVVAGGHDGESLDGSFFGLGENSGIALASPATCAAPAGNGHVAVHVGEVRVWRTSEYAASDAPAEQSSSTSIRVIKAEPAKDGDGGAVREAVTIVWEPKNLPSTDAAVDRWEVYVNGQWTGTSFCTRFWYAAKSAAETFAQPMDVEVVGYNPIGQIVERVAKKIQL
ncbi:glycosyl hydrolase family 85-domain-containing protein [Polychytrium aggregatum]|uniref:glycosyl hydrolase family 85-domain-containing protein n=1 Tax=Polychytrium aggregatum TaxID=110093 RepID=UPI0022FDED32|nr:glycosyl hydrolase family 85-domain-containing protein [Polychytrium aggregatum]KAI9205145.1 glycosyl hydrolase family 85-domain-containing protein [Polychytrium aggregatum]